ncbi:MAG: rubrerythrin family protein [Alphaproteobacteria bacterium]|nr:rubrerythrin family protein [Alphaproteobacteria bacterium]
MTTLHGTETEKNLLKSFAGESQARNRYTYFASKAKKEGYEQIAAIFEETANQEKEHAKRFFKFLEGGDLTIEATFPAGKIGTTLENLAASAAGEYEEWAEMYPAFADKADEEGFHEIAEVWRAVCVAEKFHEERYRKLHDNVEKGEVFDRVSETEWRCRNCGFVIKSTKAPELCPACAHPQAYFEIAARNW